MSEVKAAELKEKIFCFTSLAYNGPFTRNLLQCAIVHGSYKVNQITLTGNENRRVTEENNSDTLRSS
jgi:hypothetical protein